MKTIVKRPLGILLAVLLIAGLFSAVPTTVSARTITDIIPEPQRTKRDITPAKATPPPTSKY